MSAKQAEKRYHLDLKVQNFGNPIFLFGCFSLKVAYDSSKLQRLLQDTKFLFMYSLLTFVYVLLCSFILLCWGPAFKLTDKMEINWSFFLGAWHSVNLLPASVTYWTLSSSSIQWVSVSNKNLALHWQRNSYPGITLVFFIFICKAIWRVITFLPWRRCFINTPQHLLSFLSKTLPNTYS